MDCKDLSLIQKSRLGTRNKLREFKKKHERMVEYFERFKAGGYVYQQYLKTGDLFRKQLYDHG